MEVDRFKCSWPAYAKDINAANEVVRLFKQGWVPKDMDEFFRLPDHALCGKRATFKIAGVPVCSEHYRLACETPIGRMEGWRGKHLCG